MSELKKLVDFLGMTEKELKEAFGFIEHAKRLSEEGRVKKNE